jgi:DNA-binding XRE family transcriptional regulator
VTQPIRIDSPRLIGARKFGDALTRAMTRHQVGQHNLAKAAGVARSAVVQWRHGRNLPTLKTARRLAEALSDDSLLAIVREARTGHCRRCGKPFLTEGAGPKKYCSERCLRIAQMLYVPADELKTDVPVDVKKRVRALLVDVDTSLGELEEHMAAVALMCNACEPGGLCRTADCPLRPVSPLQLQLDADGYPVQLASKAPGAWKGTSRERMLSGIRAGNARRWAKPGEREAARAVMVKRHAAMSEDEHQDWIAKIKASKAAARLPKPNEMAAAAMRVVEAV